jgi:hypothetical protein
MDFCSTGGDVVQGPANSAIPPLELQESDQGARGDILAAGKDIPPVSSGPDFFEAGARLKNLTTILQDQFFTTCPG